jgi:hypothetical protein
VLLTDPRRERGKTAINRLCACRVALAWPEKAGSRQAFGVNRGAQCNHRCRYGAIML